MTCKLLDIPSLQTALDFLAKLCSLGFDLHHSTRQRLQVKKSLRRCSSKLRSETVA